MTTGSSPIKPVPSPSQAGLRKERLRPAGEKHQSLLLPSSPDEAITKRGLADIAKIVKKQKEFS